MATFSLLMLLAQPCLAGPTFRPEQTATFAYFPLAVPVSVLGETIRRDQILDRNLKKLGIKIHFIPFARGNETMDLIRKNKIDAVAFGDMPTIEACVYGRMQVVGLAKHGYSSIIGPKDSNIRDLRKKRVGNATASTGHYALLQALNSAGLSEQDVTIVPMNLNDMQQAIVTGRIDVFAAWEPVPTATIQAYPNRFAVLHRQVSLVYFLLSQQLINSRPEAAHEISAAMFRAIRWLRKSNQNLLTASQWAHNGMATFTGKPAEIAIEDIARITHAELLDVPGIPLLPKAESNGEALLFKEFSFMKNQNKLPKNATWDQVRSSFNREIMAEIIKQPARYSLNRFEYTN